ncbi:hypothetical protein ALC62_14267 [Cyphomyrmex costatus]|uniref:THAP-type domain-containing protein n=1 Tax=Cyphomyrmex costatus TaxID=456900 RepID=A0A151I9C6_9HYME|nr:hypothetical protein ALC62_14267 [Cyphomyrmex costatus]
MSCWIRDCTTRNGKNAAGEKISRFRPFTDEMFDTWKKNGISDKGTKEFTKDSYICELHFKNEDVIKEDVFHVISGPIVTIPNRKHLRKNAVPCIFPPPVSKKTEEKLSYYHVLKLTVHFSSNNIDKKTASENSVESLGVYDNKPESENSNTSYQIQECKRPQSNNSNESHLESDTWIVI